MAIAFSNLGSSANPDINSGTDASSYANTSWVPPTTGLICCFVQARDNSLTTRTPTMSGNSLTWVRIGDTYDCSQGSVSDGNGITLFAANASGATEGQTTIDFGGNTQVHCTASFFQVTGADISDGVAAAFVQNQGNKGSSGTSGSVTLDAPGNLANRPISFFWHLVTESVSPRTNWTELDDLTGAEQARGVDSQYRPDTFEVTASASWTTSGYWGGFAAEIRALWNCDVEEGNFSDFDSTSVSNGYPQVTAGAALAGSNYGIAFNAGEAGFQGAQIDLDPTGRTTYRLRLYLDPNSISQSSGDGGQITRLHCDGTVSSTYQIINITLDHDGTNKEIVYRTYDDAGSYYKPTNLDISDQPHFIEYQVIRATGSGTNDGEVHGWMDGELYWSKTDLDNYDLFASIDYIDLRFSRVGTPTGVFYLDEFVFNDTGDPIGPVAPYQIVHFLDTPVNITPTVGSWQTVNLATYVPAGASGVLVEFKNKNTANVDLGHGIQHPDSTDNRSGDMHEESHRVAWGAVNTARETEIYCETSEVECWLHGYFDGAQVKFLVNAWNFQNTVDNTWQDIDIAAASGSDVAKFAFIESNGGANYNDAVRNYGSTDAAVLGLNRYHSWHMVGVTQSGANEYIQAISEVYASCNWYVNAYCVTDRIVRYDTMIDRYSDLSLGVYADLTALPAGSIAGFYLVRSFDDANDEYFDLRPNGSTRTSLLTSPSPCYYISACDANRIVECRKDYTVGTDDVYEAGYFLGPAVEQKPPIWRVVPHRYQVPIQHLRL